MDDENRYVGKRSKELKSRDMDAFGKETRFNDIPSSRMFDDEWAKNELIPLLRRAYGSRPDIGDSYDFTKDLQQAEVIEPWHMPDYPVADPVFIERLRLALANPHRLQQPSLVASVAKDMHLTVRLLIRRYVMYGGAYRLASLEPTVRPDLAAEVAEADSADQLVTSLFVEK